MTYDQWKTTDPRDYEPEPEEGPTELEAVYDMLHGAQADAKFAAATAEARIKKLEAALEECREYLEGQSDVIDGPHGAPLPNRAMQLHSMIDETLHGPGGVR